jgi:hypothetical protein
MADTCFTARTPTTQSIITKIGRLGLWRNDSGQYTHAAITQLEKGIQRVLKQQYNPAGGINGILNLLIINNVGPQANKTTIAADILCESKQEADTKAAQKGTIVTPKITLQSDTQEEADRRNIINQALIGAKEGVVETLTKFVGTDITDAVLRRANGDYTGLNKYTLQELLQAAIDGADRPPATDVLTQLLEVINFVFDFRKKISATMESMQALTAMMKMYGIKISTPQIVLTLMTNIKVAAREDFGQEFHPAQQNICAKYT